MGKEIIPSVPTNNFEINENGLKNLAGWIARYKGFGLDFDDASPFVRELLENGTLARLEPSLKDFEVGQSGGDEEYDRYEFCVQIADFVLIDNRDSATLYFDFKYEKCNMILICYNQTGKNKILPALELMFDAIATEPLSEENCSRYITWQEADDIIVRYLQYIKNPKMPEPPKA